MNQAHFEVMMAELAASGLVRVTGSYARGCARTDSDIDLVLFGRTRRGRKPIEQAADIMRNCGARLTSIVVGQYTTTPDTCPVQVELMERCWLDGIPKRRRLPMVKIAGTWFETW
jgi:hypothetical protein